MPDNVVGHRLRFTEDLIEQRHLQRGEHAVFTDALAHGQRAIAVSLSLDEPVEIGIDPTTV